MQIDVWFNDVELQISDPKKTTCHNSISSTER